MTHTELIEKLEIGTMIIVGELTDSIAKIVKVMNFPGQPENANGLPAYLQIETKTGQKCDSTQLNDLISKGVAKIN